MTIIIYTYYGSPWKMRSGDDIRIFVIYQILTKLYNEVVAYNLSHLVGRPSSSYYNNALFISIPRELYNILAKFIKWKADEDLNLLVKLTHYIDEFILTVKLLQRLRKCKIVYVLGSMTLFSFFAYLMRVKCVFIYDPLANYAQTLYLRSGKSIIGLLKYGLYLVLHRLQIKASTHIVYPSSFDLENAKCMFKLSRASIVPNPFPICYESLKEYMTLRRKRRDFSKPYFVLLAGARGTGNREAVITTLKIFNDIVPYRFHLFVTGPWSDLKKYVENPSIRILGVVPHSKLKEILAMADYGLSPIFSHAAGTFLKVLAYLAAGLDIIVSPYSLQGIDFSLLRGKRVYIVRNVAEYRAVIQRLTSQGTTSESSKGLMRRIVLCREANEEVYRSLKSLIDPYTKDDV